jgi:hypothetical protein
MKPIVFTVAIALAAAAFSVAASAQTGAPSAQEVGRAAASSAPVEVADSDAGSYARYLMLNGKTRDEAIKEAQYVDHRPEPTRFALRYRHHAATTQQ